MKVELRLLAEIKPYENNPGLNDAAVEAVGRSFHPIDGIGSVRSVGANRGAIFNLRGVFPI